MRDAAQKDDATPADVVEEFEAQLAYYINGRRETLQRRFFASAQEQQQGLVPETRAALRELKELEDALFGTKP